MLFKINDVLEYNNGYYGIIRSINCDEILLDLSDGTTFLITKRKLINGVVNGNIKIKNLTDGLKPIPWLEKGLTFF
jgi:hypothetical protein